MFDGSLSEGAGDTAAFLQTHDQLIAPYFQTNGGGDPRRRPEPGLPAGPLDNQYLVHENGLIFGGAMWDPWNS